MKFCARHSTQQYAGHTETFQASKSCTCDYLFAAKYFQKVTKAWPGKQIQYDRTFRHAVRFIKALLSNKSCYSHCLRYSGGKELPFIIHKYCRISRPPSVRTKHSRLDAISKVYFHVDDKEYMMVRF